MKDKNGQNRRAKPRSDASEIGVVRVFSNPGPDAEDRLRRLFALLVRYATQDSMGAAQEGSPVDDLNEGETDGPEKDSSSHGVPEAGK